MPRAKKSVTDKINDIKSKQLELRQEIKDLLAKRQFEFGVVVGECGLLDHTNAQVKEIIKMGIEMYEPAKTETAPVVEEQKQEEAVTA
jgi:hypothetical protein